jgi:hypothetical protein
MKKAAALLIATMVLAPAGASACAVCMGASDSNIAPAMNAAIFTMLGCIGAVLLSLIFFIICLAHRARRPIPGHVLEADEAFKVAIETESHA